MPRRTRVSTTLTGYSLYIIRKDDEQFKLKTGDIIFGCPYKWDEGKTSIAFRLRDGYRPECNQYNNNLIPLNKTESEHAIWNGRVQLADDLRLGKSYLKNG